MDKPVWLSTSETAEFLGVGYPTVRHLINSGELVAYRVGRLIRIREEDLHRFIEANRVEPGSLINRTDNNNNKEGL